MAGQGRPWWFFWLLAGGFLGPVPGNALSVLLPVLAASFGEPVERVALAISWYMIPFAAGQFFSGAVSDRWPRIRVIAIGFAAFGLGCMLAALAPDAGFFFGAMALAGIGNAMTTPIIMALLGDVTPPGRLGRTLGVFYSVQTAALSLSPLVAGLMATARWPLFFLALAVPSASLVAVFLWPPKELRPRATTGVPEQGQPKEPDPGQERPDAGTAPPARLLTRANGLLWLSAALGYLAVTGTPFLVSLHLGSGWSLPSAQVGLVLAAFGLAGALASPFAGRWADRVGGARLAVMAAAAIAVLWVAMALSPGVMAISILYVLLGIASVTLWCGLHPLAVAASAQRRGALTSIFNGFKFVGFGLAPILYLPVREALGPRPAYLLPALAALALAGTVRLYSRTIRSRPGP